MTIEFQVLRDGLYRGKITTLEGKKLFGKGHHLKKSDAIEELMKMYPELFDIAE